MKATRRRFIQTSAMVGAGVMLAGRRLIGRAVGDPIKNLRKFVDPLPLPANASGQALSLAIPNKAIYNQTGALADFYRITMGQYQWQFHTDLPPTNVWGYADITDGRLPRFSYLGASIVAVAGTPVRIDFINSLPASHILPVDTTIPGAETGQAFNRAAVHLHGGFVPWASDGGPFQWFAPDGTHGPSLVDWLPDTNGRRTHDFFYPNAQSARLLWYHDHAVGITRLNAYAGLAAAYVLVDGVEIGMFGENGTVLPNRLPGIPLVLQEKAFKSVADGFGGVGALDYTSRYNPDDLAGQGLPLPDVSCVPEFFGDTPIINGKAFPQLTLDPGIYRFRLLNGTQSRVWNLQLYSDVDNDGDIEIGHSLDPAGPNFIQIGTEGGFLPHWVEVPSSNPMVLGADGNVPAYEQHDYQNGYSLVLGGAERADVLIDFSDSAGQNFILYNDAPAPFDSGDSANDFRTGKDAPDGFHGPNTRTLMRITINPGTYNGPSMNAVRANLDAAFANMEASLGLIVPDAVISEFPGQAPPGAIHRTKTLNEGFDAYGRLIQMLGTDRPSKAGHTRYGMTYQDSVDPSREMHQRDAVEVWDIYNTTGDVHPIHFHLVNVQILGRAKFAQNADGNPVRGNFTPSGPWIAPDPNERGYKETVRMNPGEVIRVVMRFTLPPDPVVNFKGKNRRIEVPTSPRTGGYEYVWHCHILEHEEHDMMRPLVVF